jgi:hypothetical protein
MSEIGVLLLFVLVNLHPNQHLACAATMITGRSVLRGSRVRAQRGVG